MNGKNVLMGVLFKIKYLTIDNLKKCSPVCIAHIHIYIHILYVTHNSVYLVPLMYVHTYVYTIHGRLMSNVTICLY